MALSQEDHFSNEIKLLTENRHLPNSSSLLPLHPFIDYTGILCVGGIESNAGILEIAGIFKITSSYLACKHPITKTGLSSSPACWVNTPSASFKRHFHVVQLNKTIRSVTRQCVTCRRLTTKTQPQMLGQLPLKRIAPGSVFGKNWSGLCWATLHQEWICSQAHHLEIVLCLCVFVCEGILNWYLILPLNLLLQHCNILLPIVTTPHCEIR